MTGRTKRLALLTSFGTGLAAAALFTLGGGGEKMMTSAISPDGSYRIDWVTPNRLDRLLNYEMLGPGRVELHNNRNGRLVGRSGVLDLYLGSNGQPIWLMKDIGMVSVGAGAAFLHIPPLAPDGHALPIDHPFNGGATRP